jgi:hypothetical protein
VKSVLMLSAAAGLALAAQAAFAQDATCKPPVVPVRPVVVATPHPTMPAKPACADRGSCKGADITRYNAAIGAFNAGQMQANTEHDRQIGLANTYFRGLDQYADDVNAYMACERRQVIAVVEAKP